MGLAFITEGAIPFAASDPLHVLPACIIGSGLAGALSMVFNCTLMAPHGGIFVIPCSWKRINVLCSISCRHNRFSSITWSIKEKSSLN